MLDLNVMKYVYGERKRETEILNKVHKLSEDKIYRFTHVFLFHEMRLNFSISHDKRFLKGFV